MNDNMTSPLVPSALKPEDIPLWDEPLPEELLAPKPPEPRPDLSKLPDAIVDGIPMFTVGDKIIIERNIAILKKNGAYLDTKTLKVRSIDMQNGNMFLWDESLSQWVTDNFIEGPKLGHVYKLAHGLMPLSSKGKRGRPRKAGAAPKLAPVTDADGNVVKKRRGRPAGTKNRPSDVVKAEKVARKAAKAEKKLLRGAKLKFSTSCKNGA